MAEIRLVNGRVVTPSGIVEGGLAVEAGVIVAVGPTRELPAAETTIDLHGWVALPGFIDPHVHLGTGGSADDAKFLEDLRTETAAAAIGGVTTIVSDHENAHGESWVTTRHRNGEPLLELAKQAIEQHSVIDVRLTANPVDDDDIAEIGDLVAHGVSSFKMFPSYVGAEADEFGITTVDYAYIYRVMERIAAVVRDGGDAQAMVHCEEPTICGMLKERYRAEGHDDLVWWTRARPAGCEAMQIFDVGMIARETGARIYIPHVSSEEGCRTIEYLHTRGVDIVGETCAHYLILDVPWDIGAFGKVNPPLRGSSDTEWLWGSIKRGIIEIVGSDNCHFLIEEKRSRDIWDAIPGFSEIGATLTILLSEIAAGRIDWSDLVRIGAENAARRFGMYPKKGTLSVGADGDVVVVDPDERWTLSASTPLSGADWSIYEGRVVRGRPKLTIVRGRVVAADGKVVVPPGGGRYAALSPIPPSSARADRRRERDPSGAL